MQLESFSLANFTKSANEKNLAGFPLTYLAGGSDLSNGLMGYAGFAGIAVITAGFFLFDRYVTRERLFTRPLGD